MPKIMYMDKKYSGSSFGNLEEYSEDILYEPETAPVLINKWAEPLDLGISKEELSDYQFLECNFSGDSQNPCPNIINVSSLMYKEYTLINLTAEENSNTHALWLNFVNNSLNIQVGTGINAYVWYVKGIKIGNSNIVPNPTSPYTDILSTLQINNTVFKLNGSGGSEIEPNPQEEPTDTLTSIKIDDVVYEIEGGSPSGYGYESTLLWDYVTDNNNVIPYGVFTATLHDDIDNYDQIIVEIASASGDLSTTDWNGTCLVTVDVNTVNNSYNPGYFVYTSYDQRSSRFYIHDNILQKTINNQNNTNGIVRVYGIKFSGASGTAKDNREIVSQSDVAIADGTAITLNVTKKYNDPYVVAVNVLPKTRWGGLVIVDENYGVTYDSTNNTISFKTFTNSAQNYDIDWAILELQPTFGGGSGSNVEPNPQEEPTDTLTSIKINDVVYEIEGGSGGEGYTKDLLWDYVTDNNNTVLFGLATATLHNTIDDYDQIMLEVVSASSDQTDANWKSTCQLYVDVEALKESFNPNYVLLESVASRTSRYYIHDDVIQKTSQATANTNGLVRVYGLKFGGGSGGGRSGGYSETSLYTATERSMTMQLSDDIDNYDAIGIHAKWSNGTYGFYTQIPSSQFILNHYLCTGGEGRYQYVAKTGSDTLVLSPDQYTWDGSSIITEIIGINFN